MPLARLHAPFDHPAWIFEPKLDAFRERHRADTPEQRV
jgi:hypothetical protein